MILIKRSLHQWHAVALISGAMIVIVLFNRSLVNSIYASDENPSMNWTAITALDEITLMKTDFFSQHEH